MQCRLSRHKMNKHMKYEIYWNIYIYKIYLYWCFIEKLAEHCEQFSFHCIKVCIKHTAQRQTKSAETNSIDVISLVFPDWWPRPCCLIELYIHYWLIWSWCCLMTPAVWLTALTGTYQSIVCSQGNSLPLSLSCDGSSSPSPLTPLYLAFLHGNKHRRALPGSSRGIIVMEGHSLSQ